MRLNEAFEILSSAQPRSLDAVVLASALVLDRLDEVVRALERISFVARDGTASATQRLDVINDEAEAAIASLSVE